MKKDSRWYNLDNQAIIYPAVSDHKNTNVFRISCILADLVDPIILQQALNKALKAFPYYQVVIRRGLFWYYLENTEIPPIVEQESQRPCGEIFHVEVKGLLFNVTYYNTRINLEVFHALADGGGAMGLLKTLIYEYILLRYKDDFTHPLPVLERSAAPAAQAEDSFQKYYTQGEKNTKTRSRKKAFILGGSILPYNDIQIISVETSTKAMLALAKSKNCSLTTYITALTICAIESEMMPKRYAGKDISINIPVDLRSMFPSQTFRNFFSVVDIRYNFQTSPKDFDSVLKSVEEQLKSKVNAQSLVRTLNYNISVQKNIFARVIPLVLKNYVLKAFYKKNESKDTTTISNVGRVLMPKELMPYIKGFHCLLNPTNIHKVKLCLTSFEDSLVMNFTSKIAETSIQKYFARHLSQNGIAVTIDTNWRENNETL